MFDVSWGELLVLGSVGVALAGRRDLPNACRQVGFQLGRVVGLLQGARARADRFSAQNELKQLQNELRSGLRELDQVKTELVVAASMGRTLGTTTPLANRLASTTPTSSVNRPTTTSMGVTSMAAASSTIIPNNNNSSETLIKRAASQQGMTDDAATTTMDSLSSSLSSSSPVIQSERASMEEEWEKQGISFRSVAEQGVWMNNNNNSDHRVAVAAAATTTTASEATTGSETLERILQQNLVFDQYDRVVTSQEQELEQRIKDIETKNKAARNNNNKNK